MTSEHPHVLWVDGDAPPGRDGDGIIGERGRSTASILKYISRGTLAN